MSYKSQLRALPHSQVCSLLNPSLTAPLSHYDKKMTHYSYCTRLLCVLIPSNLTDPQLQSKRVPTGLNPSVYKGSSKCDGHTPITSHFLNRKECYRRSTENRVNVEWKKFRGESFRVSPSGVRRCKTGQFCLFRPINRETSVVL